MVFTPASFPSPAEQFAFNTQTPPTASGFRIPAATKLTVSDPETQNRKAIVTAADVRPEPDGTVLMQLQEETPGLKAGDIMENETRAADFLFENNEVEGVPHLAHPPITERLRIRNNTFKRIEICVFLRPACLLV